MYRKSIIFLLLLFLYFTLEAQVRIENVEFTQEKGLIEITYDLHAPYGPCGNDMSVFYSIDEGNNWIGPLINITGDVYSVCSGYSRKIVWDVLKDGKSLVSDNVIFKITTGNSDKGYFTDFRDNSKYRWVLIGDQVWMAENLKYLPSVFYPKEESYTSRYYYSYNNNYRSVKSVKSNSDYLEYGVLYNWPAALSACPDGWHLPNDKEWGELSDFISQEKGPYAEKDKSRAGIGGHLKSKNGWKDDGNGTDDFSFALKPGGYRNGDSTFMYLGERAYLWVKKEGDSIYMAWSRRFGYNREDIYHAYLFKDYGCSIRCVKD